MNARERFLRIMSYQPVDRLPVLPLEPIEKDTIRRWHGEGLPECSDPFEFLNMSRFVRVPVNFRPIPPFEEDVVEEEEHTYVARSYMGALVRRHRDHPTTFYGHIDHPVKTREDWEIYKERFRFDSPGRLPVDWNETAIRKLNSSDLPVGVTLSPCFFRLGFYSMGMERFLTAFHEEPDLMQDIFSYWSDFLLRTLKPVLESVRLDYVLFTEDLAGRNGPLVSPRIYEEFWYPNQDPIIRLLQCHEVPVICQWSAGRFHELIPGMMEHGFTCTWPLEKMAGMEARDVRRRFGKKLLLAGNIPKEAVIAGPEAIDREIERLMPLIREGGFLPALDDVVSEDMPFSHYRHLIERLEAIRLDG